MPGVAPSRCSLRCLQKAAIPVISTQFMYIRASLRYSLMQMRLMMRIGCFSRDRGSVLMEGSV